MKFHKLKPSSAYHRPAPITDNGICSVCNIRPVAGYVLGSGQYLSRTCLRCYRAADIESSDHGQFRTHGSFKQSRS